MVRVIWNCEFCGTENDDDFAWNSSIQSGFLFTLKRKTQPKSSICDKCGRTNYFEFAVRQIATKDEPKAQGKTKEFGSKGGSNMETCDKVEFLNEIYEVLKKTTALRLKADDPENPAEAKVFAALSAAENALQDALHFQQKTFTKDELRS